MITSRGGMGMRKHGISGIAGPNRRGLQALAREVNRMANANKKKKSEPMFGSVSELMKSRKKK